jgi:diphthamide biosynthesis protein 3
VRQWHVITPEFPSFEALLGWLVNRLWDECGFCGGAIRGVSQRTLGRLPDKPDECPVFSPSRGTGPKFLAAVKGLGFPLLTIFQHFAANVQHPELHQQKMADSEEEIAVYDEVEIEDMTFDETLQIYHYPCPCGDRFEIALVDLQDESTDIAVCPSCSLMIRVIYDVVRPDLCQLWNIHRDD